MSANPCRAQKTGQCCYALFLLRCDTLDCRKHWRVLIAAMNLPVNMTTKKLSEGHPNVVDVINDGSVRAVINTISGASEVLRDGFYIRRAAVEHNIPCFTSLDTARAAVESLVAEQVTYSIGSTEEYLNGP